MSIPLLFVLFFGLVLTIAVMRRELNVLQRRIMALEDNAVLPSEVEPGIKPPIADEMPEPEYRSVPKTAARRVASVVSTEIPADDAVAQPGIVESPVEYDEPVAPRGASFEALMGAKLPIWVGGISLVFAGFFLVRYSIEAGLFGPVARSVTATLFAFVLIALSEFGSRLPRIGDSFADDPRVAQSLAGAGVASLYATLYMASEIYGLIDVPVSFVLVIAVTALAFALSLRRGPPTAVMGVIGGFAAPWVAGMGASSVPTLLLYLGIFVAAVFGLAIWRRWLWLLLLASGGGTLWTLSLIATADSALPLIGLFVILSGAGAVFAVGRFGAVSGQLAQLARYAPMALAVLQLAMLLPKMEFSGLGWALYGALGVLTAILAWRDMRMLPLFAMAALVAVAPLTASYYAETPQSLLIAVSAGYALLFGIPGYLRAHDKDGAAPYWGIIGLLAPVVAFYIPFAADTLDWSATIWAVLAAALAVPPAYLAKIYASDNTGPRGIVLILATALSALMAATALLLLVPVDWIATALITVAMSIAAWAKPTVSRGVARLAILPLAAGIITMTALSYELIGAALSTMWGDIGSFAKLPLASDLFVQTAIPSILMIATARVPLFALGSKTAKLTFAIGAAGLAACAWHIAKQPFAIATPADFIRYGFAERMVITHILFAAGYTAIHFSNRLRDPGFWVKLGMVLAGMACARILYFDLLILNPVVRAQQLGPAPFANLGTMHMALTTLWLWLLSRSDTVAGRFPVAPKPLFMGSLGAAILTTFITVRQMAQGTLVSGAGIQTGENYLYSFGLLVLALAWLTRGIMTGAAVLRVAGLGLLTAVTFKVFLIDAAALTGILRILSFLGLGIALIGIGWAYGRLTRRGEGEGAG